MTTRRAWAWGLAFAVAPGGAVAASHPRHLAHHRAPSHPGPSGAGASGTKGVTFPYGLGGGGGGGWGWFVPPYYVTIGPTGPVMLTPPWATPAPSPVVVVDGGPVGGPMPAPVRNPVAPESRPRRKDPARAGQLVTIGDRLFRVGNHKRAEERYEQAVRADPDSASPRIRLAQIALVRGRFGEAAGHVRDAVSAQPGWLETAPDIQRIYGEPADFARQISKLESRILIEPNDRDAWLVLGAELFLSGQTRRASDVFLRLSDRKPDAALAAFLDASAPEGNAGK